MPSRHGMSRKEHQDSARKRIQTTILVQLLMDMATGKIPELSTGRVNAIKILLGKALPDLQSIEMDAVLEGKQTLLDVLNNGVTEASTGKVADVEEAPDSVH